MSIFLLCVGIGDKQFVLAQTRVVDIDAPGVLDALARDNPRHYERIHKIISEVQRQPDSEVALWMPVRFDVRDVVYGPLLLVTDPPKRHLSFTIDEVRYKTIVTLTNRKPKPIRVR